MIAPNVHNVEPGFGGVYKLLGPHRPRNATARHPPGPEPMTTMSYFSVIIRKIVHRRDAEKTKY